MTLFQILYGIHAEQAVGLRTKAMRCLTLIIEADHAVLKIVGFYYFMNYLKTFLKKKKGSSCIPL